MKTLLDTHIRIWSANCPGNLGKRARRELDRTSNELYLSPVSIWEAHYRERRKRLRVKPDFSQWLDKALDQVPLRGAPFTFTVAAAASRTGLSQSDPGDVFLAATACAFDLTLVTADSQLLACTWLKTLSND